MSLTLTRTKRKSVVRYETETLDLKARIVAAGGTIQDDALRWVDDFVLECKARGLWSELIEVGLFVGDQLAGALVKLLPVGGTALANTNFVGGDYAERGANGGLLGANTKFLNTGYVLDGSAAGMLGFYNRTAMGSVIRFMIGVVAGAPACGLYRNMSMDAFDFGSDNVTVSRTNTTGLYVGVKPSSTEWRFYAQGALIGSKTAGASSTLPNAAPYLFARNADGVAADFWAGRGSFYCIGTANWTGTMVGQLNDAVAALQSKLGRA